MEEAHRETEQRYHEIIENAHDIIQSTRPDGTLAFVNQAWHEALGYTKAEIYWRALKMVIIKFDRQKTGEEAFASPASSFSIFR
jgi:PAS domain S-box-containing protein